MKKERKVSLVFKKVSISKLDTIVGQGGKVSIDLPCAITAHCGDSEMCTIPGVDCKTFVTANDSDERC
ncbi:MAG: hypothetical protein AAF617_16885 [Bacteroidota bacterium]